MCAMSRRRPWQASPTRASLTGRHFAWRPPDRASPTSSPALRTRGPIARPSSRSAARRRSRPGIAAHSRTLTSSPSSSRPPTGRTPCTKCSDRVHHVRRIPELNHLAVTQAMTGKPGPVYLDMPGDILYQEVDESKIEYPTPYNHAKRPRPAPSAAEVRAIVDLMVKV